MRVEATAAGVSASYTFDSWQSGVPGVVHGGLLMLLLDEVLGSIGPDRPRVTIRFNVEFKMPVFVCETVELVGHADSRDEGGFVAVGRVYPPNTYEPATRATASYRYIDPVLLSDSQQGQQ